MHNRCIQLPWDHSANGIPAGLVGALLGPQLRALGALPQVCRSAPPSWPIRLQGIRPLPLRLLKAGEAPEAGECTWEHVVTGLARRRRLLVAVPLAPRGARPTRQAAQAMQPAAGGGQRHLPAATGSAAAPLPAAAPGGLEPAPPTEAAATPPAASAGSRPLPSRSISAFNTSVQARRDPIKPQ